MKREVTKVVRMKWNLVAVCRMTSGKTAITLPPSTRVAHFQKVLMESDKVSSIEWYYTTDAFFYNYPHPLTVKLYYVDEALLAQHLKEDERIRQTAGNENGTLFCQDEQRAIVFTPYYIILTWQRRRHLSQGAGVPRQSCKALLCRKAM